MHLETALADVFNREFQCHAAGEDWEPIMRNVAREIAFVLHPDNADARALFLDSANWSGLFPEGA